MKQYEGYHADLHGMAYARQLGVMIADDAALAMGPMTLGLRTRGDQR